MVDSLSQLTKPKLIPIGNFRYLYFKRHEKFYETLLDAAGLKKSFILYAPTWKDAENSSSFERAASEVAQRLSHLPLVIKPHPNDLENIRVIQEQQMSKATWLTHFPPIYPLLARTSHLIGDFSSIGYDFLMFNRPMFFLPPDTRTLDDPGCFLHKYGTVISENNVSSLPALLNTTPQDVKLLTAYTFGEASTWPERLKGVKQLDI
jgi:CDP-glycerol glycerophosphotransferase (TagB/SpsB family)